MSSIDSCRGLSTVDPSHIKLKSAPPCADLKSFQAAALCWHEFGFQVVPIKPDTKITVVKWDPWLENLSTDQIKAHWAQYPNHEVGLIVSDNYIVFDADTPEAIAALAGIEEAFDLTSKLIIKTARGVHHYFKRALGSFAKTDSHSTADYPERIDVKTGRSMVVLPPSTGKFVEINEAANAGELTEADQGLIDAVSRHNGREAPRKRIPSPSAPKVTPANLNQKMRELNAMLDHIDPDLGYDDWVHVLMAIYHESGGSEEGLAIADAWSSRGSKYCGEREMRTKWSSFADYDGTPITVATIRKMLTDQGVDWQAVCAATEPEFEACETEVIHGHATSTTAPTKPPSPLKKYSLRGMSAELEKQGVDQVFLLGDLALLGESSVLCAAPNLGKTLTTLAMLIEAIKAGKVDPDNVYYVNIDDSLAGLTQKLRIAEEFGFHMLAEGHKGFKASRLLEILFELMTGGQAHGVVLLLDTLKKFTNLMDKTKVAHFNSMVRGFVMQGGTVIALAHTNKNPGPGGKPQYGGTSDVVDDADCVYIIDTLDASDPTHKVVVFENIKRRGNNAQKACYRYSTESGQSYESLLASVARVEEADLLTLKHEAKLKSDAAVIDAIVAAIQHGVTTKMKLADAASERAGCSKRAALKIIEKYTGTDPSRHRWTYEVRDRGAKFYALIDSIASTKS